MPERSLTIVLPAYNEEARLGPALDELFGYLHRRGERARTAGPARTSCRATSRSWSLTTAAPMAPRAGAGAREAARGELEVLTVPHGGKGAAVRAGMLAARGDLVIFTDADMATPPDELAPMVAALERADAVYGSRIQPDGTDMRKSQPRWRRALGKAFHVLASIWVVGPVQDTQCGFKGFHREVARDVFSRQKVTSIVFDVEVIYLVRRRGYTHGVLPISWADRRGSRMHPGLRLAIRVAWDLFRIPLLHRDVRRAHRGTSDQQAA
jgi:dolichyl-phosphate beta-glucosyltransferase